MEKILYPNCSEATVRLNVNHLSESEIKKLQVKLMKWIIDNQNKDEDGTITQPLIVKNRKISDIENDFHELVYETSIDNNTVWGVKTLTVKGDFPYNHPEEMDAFAIEHNLSKEYDD